MNDELLGVYGLARPGCLDSEKLLTMLIDAHRGDSRYTFLTKVRDSLKLERESARGVQPVLTFLAALRELATLRVVMYDQVVGTTGTADPRYAAWLTMTDLVREMSFEAVGPRSRDLGSAAVTVAAASAGAPTSSTIMCYNCQQRGHKSYECTLPRSPEAPEEGGGGFEDESLSEDDMDPDGVLRDQPPGGAAGQLRPFDMSRKTPALQWQRQQREALGDASHPTRSVDGHRPSRRRSASEGDLEFEVL